MKTITLDDGRNIVLDIDAITPEQGMVLAEAVTSMLVRSGRVRDDVALSGPHLLQFVTELGDELAQEREEQIAAEKSDPAQPPSNTAGDLDAGVPNHIDHHRRGFQPR